MLSPVLLIYVWQLQLCSSSKRAICPNISYKCFSFCSFFSRTNELYINNKKWIIVNWLIICTKNRQTMWTREAWRPETYVLRSTRDDSVLRRSVDPSLASVFDAAFQIILQVLPTAARWSRQGWHLIRMQIYWLSSLYFNLLCLNIDIYIYIYIYIYVYKQLSQIL